MKNYLLGLTCLIALLVATQRDSLEWDASEAIAVSSSTALSVTCTEGTVTAFSPDISYTLNIATPSRGTVPSGSTHTVSAVLANGMGDANPSVTTANSSTATKVNFWHLAPKSKLGGLQCTTYQKSKVEALGDSSDDNNFEISFQGLSATTYNAANKVDNVNSGNYVTVFGTGGIVSAQDVWHSFDSESDAMDGEVTVGPGSATMRGGYRMVNELKYLTINPGTITETLTLLFTPN